MRKHNMKKSVENKIYKRDDNNSNSNHSNKNSHSSKDILITQSTRTMMMKTRPWPEPLQNQKNTCNYFR